MKHKQKILVTGAGGFLGKALVQELSKSGFDTVAVTSQKVGLKSFFSKNVAIYNNSEYLEGLIDLSDVCVLIHGAFTTQSNREELAKSLLFSQQIYKKAISNGVSSIINLSTRSVYGADASLTTTEQALVAPINEYGLAKYASELLLESVAKNTDTCFSSLRLSSLLGAELDVRIVNKFIKSAIELGQINIVGGQQCFSFMDVRDAVDAIMTMAKSNSETWGRVYNLGSNQQYSITELAKAVQLEVKKQLGSDVVINIESKNIQLSAGMDSSKFYADFGWEPSVNLRTTVQDIIEHVKQA